MGKRIWFGLVIFILILTTGCDLNFLGIPQETAVGISDSEIATLSAYTTQANLVATETPDFSAFTSTPLLEVSEKAVELPTRTTMPGSIKISSITQKSPGVALIQWEVTGEFPSGFKVVFTDQQGKPTFPENSYITVGSSTARSAVINYAADRIYYVRVCRFLFDACDLYSDLGIFSYAPPTKTPKPTKIPSNVVVNGTVVSYDASLKITMMKGGGDGKAYIAWTDTSGSSLGYKIVYSTSSMVPTIGTDAYFSVRDSKARSAFVSGNSATKYYYRICRASGTGCGSYSMVYSYTFPTYTLTDDSTITMVGLTEINSAVAKIAWTASGSFPNGFKILYSKTNPIPTLSDSVIEVNDGSARSGTITVDPSSPYYVRVCKFNGTSCSIYSEIVQFNTALTGFTLTNSGNLDIYDWSIPSSNLDGYRLFWKDAPFAPAWSGSLAQTTISDSAARTVTLGTSLSSGHYILRLCTWDTASGSCTTYSNTLEITVP